MRFIFLILSAIFVSDLSSQVNLQNGSANYEIPIFSFSDAKSGLGTGVSLSYSSGNGLVVSNKASNTGQNWSLIAGGAIFRKQNGEPDDQNSTAAFPTIPNGNVRGFNQTIAVYDDDYQSYSYTGDPYSRNYIDNYYPNGYMYSEFGLDMVEMTQNNWPLYHLAPRELALIPRFRSNMDKKWKLSRRALTDRQQDVYIYNFNGISGEFVIGRDGNPLQINDSKIIIEKSTSDLTSQNIRTRINEFTIKDPSGTIYKFSAYELSEIMKFNEISSEGTNAFRKITTSGEPTGKYTIQKWLLTEIINPITQEKIVFEYENYTLDVIIDKTPNYQYTEGQSTESVQVYEQRAKGQLKRLKNILLPDGHKVQFFYNTTQNRVDVPGDHALIQVKLSYNDENITTYNLNYGYFLKKEIKNYTDLISESDKRFTRLCLTSVQKAGANISEPAYKMNYHTGVESSDPKDIVPPFDCMAQDHWGYYNKVSLVNIDDPNPAKEVLKDLMLNNSTYRQPSPGAAQFGLLKSVENPFGGKLTFEYEQNDSKDSDNPSITVAAGGVRVLKTTLFDGVNSVNDIVTTYNYKMADGSTSGWGYESPTYLNRREIKIWNASTPDGYTKDGVLINDISNSLAKFFAKQTAMALFKAFLGKATVTAISSSGNPAIAIAAIIIGGLIDRLFVLFNPNDYVWTNSYNFSPFQLQNSIGINYSRVEAVNSSLPGGTGKTVSEFTAPVNVRSEIPAFTMPYSTKQRYAGWKYGLPSKTSVYNQSGSLIKEVANTYSIFATTVVNDNCKSSKVEVTRPESASCWGATNNLPITDFSWEYYYPITGRVELTSSVEKNYSPTGILSQTDLTMTYNNDYLDNMATTTKSNGDIIKVKKYYTNDYNNISTAIQEMKARNMVVVPISTETWLIKPGGTEYLLDATINEFSLLANGEIKIKKIYKLESKQPLLKSIIGEQNPAVLIRNTTYFKEQLNFNYDNNGLLLETTTPESRVSSKIYDYNNRIVTAEIVNAAQSEVAYSSFETDQKGGWQYNLNNFLLYDGVTGKKCFHFPATQTTITRSVTGSKTYILSLWNKGTGISVLKDASTLTAVKTVANSVTGWTYKEYTFSGAGNISISNTSGATSDLDELRLYPQDARMATVAHDPKIGKTAECDVNNRILYYEYDGLNRLQTIRDDKMNILKKLCYNYSGEPEDCNLPSEANWMIMGPIRCKPCEANPNYTYNYEQRQERDINPQSSTFNQIRWYDLYANHTCVPAVWQPTGNLRCVVDANNNNTGYQEREERDVNPCSPSYNWLLWVNNGINQTACPPASCNTSNCSGNNKKCINGICETGTWAVVSSVYKKVLVDGYYQWRWVCTWRYCFSDGSQSTYYEETINTSSCPITCYVI